MSKPDLKTTVARALHHAASGDQSFDKIPDDLRTGFERMAEAALRSLLDEVLLPEYRYWRETEEIAASGAVANIVARLFAPHFEGHPEEQKNAPRDRTFLELAARTVEGYLPDGTAFLLLAALPADQPPQRVVYTANMPRESAVAMLREKLFAWGKGEEWMKHLD